MLTSIPAKGKRLRRPTNEAKAMSDRYRELNDERFDVIVVGAGTGGLTAAAILARRGKKVLLVDQHMVAGGNATIFRRRGYEFDIGLHYIGACQADGMLTRVLRAAGVDDIEFEELDPDGYDTIVFPDFEFRIPKGMQAFRDRLCEYFPRETRGIDRYFTLLGQVDGFSKLMGNPAHAPSTILRSLMLLRWRNATLGEFLDSCTTDVRLRAVLTAQHGTYGLPPSRASVLVHAAIALHYMEGAYYPKGGGQVISDRLAEAVERHGGKILLLTRAERIVVRDGKVTGVELNSRHLGRRFIEAPVVISDADLKRTLIELVGAEHLQSKTVDRTHRFKMSPALGVVYLGINRDLKAEHHPRTNYLINPGYDYEPSYAAAARGEFPDPVFAYATIASLKDPTNARVAPRGITNLQVMSIVPSDPQAWGVTAEEASSRNYGRSELYRHHKLMYARSIVAAAERVFPGLSNQIAYEEVATPLTQSRYTGSTGGTSYGIALTPDQFILRRPGTKTEVEGLYLCGASCRTGHGIMGVALSGLLAAAEVTGDNLVREALGAARQD
jgi:phytoene desaturase